MHCLRFEKKDEQLSRWQSFMATRGRTRVLFIFFFSPTPSHWSKLIPSNEHWHYNIYYNDASAAYLQPLREITLYTTIPPPQYRIQSSPIIPTYYNSFFGVLVRYNNAQDALFPRDSAHFRFKIQSLSEFRCKKNTLYIILFF